MTPTVAEAELFANERLDQAGLRALQLSRLRATLAHAWQGNRAWRARCEAAGVGTPDIGDLADLARFPLLGKDDLRAHYPFGYFAVPMDRIVRLHASSGTTGLPTVVGYTREDIATWAGLVARSLHAAGGRPGMKVHIAYGYGLFTGGLGAHYGAEALGCSVIPVSGGNSERQVQLIRDFQPDIIMCSPSYMLALADAMRAAGIDPLATSLRIGVFGAEPWTEAMRREIEQATGVRAVDIYGLSEVIGPGVAQEYGALQDGPTIWEDHFYPEVIDPESGEVLPDGAEGELVFTSLTKQAMPIVRYRTRDLTRLVPGTVGPMRRMARVSARSDDMLIVRGVNLFPSQIEEQVLRMPALAPHFQIELDRPERLDLLTVRSEARDAGAMAGASALAAELEHHIKALIGVSAHVVIEPPGALTRFEGKARRVVDRRTG